MKKLIKWLKVDTDTESWTEVIVLGISMILFVIVYCVLAG